MWKNALKNAKRWTFRQNGGAFALLPIYERNVQIKMKNLYLIDLLRAKLTMD